MFVRLRTALGTSSIRNRSTEQSFSFLLMALLTIPWSVAPAPAQSVDKSASPAANINWVPITYRQDSGTRPFIPVTMNGKPFLMMVHSNASFYVQTTHANAASIGLSSLGKNDDYGIDKDGHVSPLGRTTATLDSLKVGTAEARKVQMAVFEVPQTPVMNGMLGTGWLRDQKVIVDFDQHRVGTPASIVASGEFDKGLLARGYVAHKMTWDPKKRTWFVMGTIDGHAIRLCVSTVADNVVDIDWAKANGIELGPVIDQQGGPAGAMVDEYLVKHVLDYALDGQSAAPAQPVAWDLSAYSSATRSGEPHNEGYLGASFMLANQAVIDFGTEILFVAKWKGASTQSTF